jgi:hypothetical protein
MIATHVSSPIRSASASGPIGWAKPSFAIVSIASASATPSCSAQTASLMNGIRIRFETKPGKSLATAGVLPRSSASATIAEAVSSDVSRPRTISTSFSTGTGLKKCIPITRSGRSVTEASEVIGIEDVFEARTAPRAGSRRRGGRPSCLDVCVSIDGLDQERGRHEFVDRRDAPEHLVGVGAALLRKLLEARAHGGEPPLGRAGVRVVERDVTAGGGDDLRDPATHLAGSDDQDVSKSMRR